MLCAFFSGYRRGCKSLKNTQPRVERKKKEGFALNVMSIFNLLMPNFPNGCCCCQIGSHQIYKCRREGGKKDFYEQMKDEYSSSKSRCLEPNSVVLCSFALGGWLPKGLFTLKIYCYWERKVSPRRGGGAHGHLLRKAVVTACGKRALERKAGRTGHGEEASIGLTGGMKEHKGV